MNCPSKGIPNDAILSSLSGKQDLTRNEIRTVFEHIPLVVIADDIASIRNSVTRMITAKLRSVRPVRPYEGNILRCFDELGAEDPHELPVMLCKDSQEAREVIEKLLEVQAYQGVLVFDDDMGHPKGSELFETYQNHLPAGMARVLHTGGDPINRNELLARGVLDALNLKQGSRLVEDIAQAYLKRNAHSFAKSGQ